MGFEYWGTRFNPRLDCLEANRFVWNFRTAKASWILSETHGKLLIRPKLLKLSEVANKSEAGGRGLIAMRMCIQMFLFVFLFLTLWIIDDNIERQTEFKWQWKEENTKNEWLKERAENKEVSNEDIGAGRYLRHNTVYLTSILSMWRTLTDR